MTKFNIRKAFEELTMKIDALANTDEIEEEIDEVIEDVADATEPDASAEDRYDAKAAIEALTAKVDKLLTQPKTVRVKKNVPAAPARRPVKVATAEPPTPQRPRRSWYKEG